MLILLEGPDGAGKTTLAAELKCAISRRQPNSEVLVWHRGPPKEHPLLEYEAPLFWPTRGRNYRPGTNLHIICDRWHLGERVYAAILGRTTQMEPAVWLHIELFLRSRGALLVQVDAPLDVLQERIRRNGDDLVNVDQLSDIQLGYGVVLQQTCLRTAYDDTTRVDLLMGADEIVDMAIEQDTAHQALNTFATYVGARYPKLLLLGDVRNVPAAVRQRPTPAFMPYTSTSGLYLLRSLLDQPNWSYGDIGIANACDSDDIRALYQALGEPHTVALGVNASKRARTMSIPVRSAPHPQFVRRFHHMKSQAYAEQILLNKEHSWN